MGLKQGKVDQEYNKKIPFSVCLFQNKNFEGKGP